jgi:lycopene cyclase domain-containing protein
MNLEYLIILTGILIVTILLEKIYHIHLYHNRKERLSVTLIFFIVGVVWDTFAIWRGHWAFPMYKTLGIKIGLMPIEEYLFILIIPYFVLTIYKIFESKWKK